MNYYKITKTQTFIQLKTSTTDYFARIKTKMNIHTTKRSNLSATSFTLQNS